jgi:heat shock protein HtpX
VVAHEAAHLLHEDSKLAATTCFLFGVFGKIHSILGEAMRGGRTGVRSSRDRGGLSGAILVLWLLSGLGYLVTRLVSMAISREREYLADAHGVAMCKDPHSMAEGLFKISNRYRGDMPETYSALFILNPRDSKLDDQEGFFARLFSNHPPVGERLSKLLHWAKSDLETLRERARQEEKEKAERVQAAAQAAAPAPGPGFMVFLNGAWAGPYTVLQLLSMGSLTPSTWVCPAGGQEVQSASQAPELLPLFEKRVQGAVSPSACPRCKVSLVKVRYEGAEAEQCSFCRGYLLRTGVLERIILREETPFFPEEVRKNRLWRDSQTGPLKGRDTYGEIKCPHCRGPMGKGIHSVLTQAVVDRCGGEKCGTVWCDGGELETIQMMMEDARKGTL